MIEHSPRYYYSLYVAPTGTSCNGPCLDENASGLPVYGLHLDCHHNPGPSTFLNLQPASSVMAFSRYQIYYQNACTFATWQPFHHPRLARCHPIPDPRCPCPTSHSQGLRFKQRLFTSFLLWFMPPFHSYHRPGKFLLLSFYYFSTKNLF